MSPLDKDIANLWIPIRTRPTECTVLPYFWLSFTFWSNIYFYYLFIYSLISSKVTMENCIDLNEITKFLNQYPSRYTVLHGLYTVPDRKWRILNYRPWMGQQQPAREWWYDPKLWPFEDSYSSSTEDPKKGQVSSNSPLFKGSVSWDLWPIFFFMIWSFTISSDIAEMIEFLKKIHVLNDTA